MVDEHIALDETACSIIGEKDHHANHASMTMKSSRLSHNPNLSCEAVEESLAVIDELERILESFEDV